MFSSCIAVSQRSVRYLQDTGVVYPRAEFTRYKLQKNDELKLNVSSFNPDQTKIFNTEVSYRINPDGTMNIPFVDKIRVEGLTLRDARTEIERRMRAYIPDAVVNVTLANNVFYSLGRTGKASYDIYKENLNIFQALALTGEIDLMGDFKNVKIIRPEADGNKIINLDIRSASIVDSEYYYIRPNDIIYVPSSKGVFYKTTTFTGTMAYLTTFSSLVLLVLTTTN
jgi:polysaccharide export outer membrane protein